MKIRPKISIYRLVAPSGFDIHWWEEEHWLEITLYTVNIVWQLW